MRGCGRRSLARAAWGAEELARVGLQDSRHTAASVMIAAGLNVKALTEFMGHSSITTTFDRYGHLLPGAIDEATVLLDAYLAGVADGQAKASDAGEHLSPPM